MTIDVLEVVLPAMLGLGSSLVLTGFAVIVLRRAGVEDVPNSRSSHVRVTVRGAGIGLALAAVLTGVAMIVVDDLPARQMIALVMGSAAFAVLGLVDDVRSGTPARWRLVAQVLLALVLAAGLVVGVEPAIWLVLAMTAAAIWIVAYVNAFNFMDGINGISAVSAIVAGSAYAVMGLALDDLLLVVTGSIVTGASLGFLPFNFPRARAFLGDVGSYFLGAWLAASAMLVMRAGGNLWSAIAPLSLYLADTGWTIVCRARRGENLLSAHRSHVYQRLATGSRSHVAVAVTVGSLTAFLSLIAVLTVDSSLGVVVAGGALSMAVLAGYLALPMIVCQGPPYRATRNG